MERRPAHRRVGVRVLRRAILLGFAALAVSAASAGADSLVYTKGGDIWRAAPDGRGAVKLTSGGDFSSPSQANDGTVLATDGRSGESCRRQIVRLAPSGKVLARLNVLGPKSPSLTALGPWYPQVSPDGRRVAFGETLINSDVYSPICEGGSSEALDEVKVADARSGAGIGLIAPHASLWTPSWLPDGRVLVFAPYNITAAQVGYGNPGESPTGWFSDPKEDSNAFPPRQYISDGQVSPNGSTIAYVRGENTAYGRERPTIEIAHVVSLSSPPVVRCDIPVSGAPVENPTWSPDSRSLAWSEPDGIHTTSIASGSGPCGASPRLVIPGGRHPSWGPYSGAQPAFRIQVTHSLRRTALVRTGVTARVSCTHACRIDAQLTTRSRGRLVVLGRASARLRRAGTTTLHIRFTKTAARQVKRGARLQLRIHAQPGGARTSTIQVR